MAVYRSAVTSTVTRHSRREPGYRRMSDAELNARALSERGRTYSSEHAASMSIAWNRTSHRGKALRELVRIVRRAATDEVPLRLHERPEHVDAGGAPEMTPAFIQYLDAPAATTERAHSFTGEGRACERCEVLADFHEDPAFLAEFRTPFRAALSHMAELGDETSRKRAEIVNGIASGQGPAEAAMAAGISSWAAKIVAADALVVFCDRLSDLRLTVRSRQGESAA